MPAAWFLRNVDHRWPSGGVRLMRLMYLWIVLLATE